VQQPIFAMSPHLPCIERQQALSSLVIADPVIHASRGAAAVSRMKIATKLARRRIDNDSIDQWIRASAPNVVSFPGPRRVKPATIAGKTGAGGRMFYSVCGRTL
jgi:hypothetical protein